MYVTAKCFPCGSGSYSKHFPRGTSYKPFFPSHGYLWEQAQPHSFKEGRELLLCFVPLSFQFFPKSLSHELAQSFPEFLIILVEPNNILSWDGHLLLQSLWLQLPSGSGPYPAFSPLHRAAPKQRLCVHMQKALQWPSWLSGMKHSGH